MVLCRDECQMDLSQIVYRPKRTPYGLSTIDQDEFETKENELLKAAISHGASIELDAYSNFFEVL